MTFSLSIKTAADKAAEAQSQLRAAVNAEKDRRINAGLTFNGKLFQSDAESRENIQGAATVALAAIQHGTVTGDLRWHKGNVDFVWIAADNTEVAMDAQTMWAFGEAAMAHKQAHVYAAKTLKDLPEIPADFTADKYWP